MSKLEKKLWSWIWFLVAIYPFLLILVNWGTGNDIDLFPSFFIDIGDWIGTPLYQIFSSTGYYFPTSLLTVCNYVGYLIIIEVLRLLADILLWLFRFARKLLEKPFGGN